MYLIHARKRPSVKNAAVVSVAGYMGLESNGLGVSFKAGKFTSNAWFSFFEYGSLESVETYSGNHSIY